MKKYIQNVCKLTTFVGVSLLGMNTSSSAQMVGTDIFLKGLYVEVGQCNVGSFGTCGNAPAGYNPRPFAGATTGILGFVSDPGLDGWTVGTPAMMGDYFVPGSPHEGWSIQIGANRRTAWGACAGFGGTGPALTGSNVNHEVIGRTKVANWSGAMGNLSINSRTILDTIRSFFVVEVTLENVGTTPLDGIYYERTVDPDNEQTISGSFNTTNTIVYQPSADDMKCLVTATGAMYPEASYMGLGAKDCRAKCYILSGGLWPDQNPSNIYDGTYANTGQGFTNTSDVGIGIVFQVGTLNPGEMTSLAYAYILKESDLDTAFQMLGASFEIDGANVSSNDTFVVCRGKELEVNISGGGAYVWGEWTPNIGLSNPTGRHNTITVQDEIITYQVIGTTTICPQSDTLTITIIPVGDTFSINASVCAGEIYDFNGQPVFTPGVYYQTHSTVIDGCDSVVKLNFAVNPLPGVDITVDNNNICSGDVANFHVTNPTPNTNYQWLLNGSPISGATDRYYQASSVGGEYRVVGVTNRGCVDTSRRITIVINPAATVNIIKQDYGRVCIGDTIDIAVEAKPGYEYYWEPEKSFRYTSGARHAAVKGIMFEDVNEIKVRAVNEFGCIGYDYYTVYAVPCCDVYLPSAFSPNNDGLNDYFTMKLREGQHIVSFQIFDRSGRMVYDNGNKLGWDGLDLDGNEVAQAVYFYRIVYSCTDKKNYEAKGDITLVK